MDITDIFKRRVGLLTDGCFGTALILCALVCLGCGSYIGVTTQPAVFDAEHWVVGPEVGYRGYAANSQGLILGGSASFLNKPKDECCYQVRARGEVGYGVCPLLHESHFGFEAALGPTFGNVAVGDQGHFAVGGTATLAVPYRVNRSRDLWQQNAVMESIWLVVPQLGYEMLVPVGDVDHRPRSAMSFSLNVRFMQWPTIVP